MRSVTGRNIQSRKDLYLAREKVSSKLAVLSTALFGLFIFAVLWEVGR